ncbi:MAG: DUF4358 domain-containing protein [Lachnospiraceae bacterium]|nr:DUF4358 domain-containing protein [Lachnospiraceae bacterium]MCI9675029.1 DUF4358 domain-containing protein [Lachnospiraceae bacterium]
MKRFGVLLCTGMMVLSLSACGGNQGNNDGSVPPDSPAQGSQTQDDQASGSQTQDDQASGSQTQGDQTQSSQPQGGSETQGNGHNYEEGWTEEMEGIKTAIVNELGENYFPDMALLPDMLEASFGITADMYDDYLAEMPMISANVDTMLIIRAKDDKVEEVENALNAYREAQVGNTMQYPKNIGIIQASRVDRIGNYVCYLQLGGNTMDVMDQGDDAVILHCQELNESVLEIIKQNVQSD